MIYNQDLFKRTEFACAAHEDRYIFVAGGRQRGLNSAAVYDMLTDTQITLPEFPDRLHSCGGTISNGYFYVVSYGKIYRMSIVTRSKWELVYTELLHTLEFEGYVDAVHSHENRLYIFTNSGREVIVYDTVTNECIVMPPTLESRDNFASAVVGDKIYIIGGWDVKSDKYLSSVEVFDIPTQSWSTAPPVPRVLYGAAATVFGRWIILVGGINSTLDSSSPSFVFDTSEQKWTETDVGLSPPRINHSCVTIGSQIVSVGGEYEWEKCCSIEAIDTQKLVSKWEVIKPFVLMQRLIEDGRAYPVTKPLRSPKYAAAGCLLTNIFLIQPKIHQDKKRRSLTKKGAKSQTNTDGDMVLEKLMTDMCDRIFKQVLSYLV